METFSCSVNIWAGPGAVDKLQTLKPKRLFLITDPYFVSSGDADRVVRASGAEAFQIFSRVTPDPSVQLAAEGTLELKAFGPDLLVALGGGSSLDCAKAISYFLGEKIPLAAIPTTSGSGSEVTDFAILTHDRVKHPLVDPGIQPDYAILDSDFLKNLPKGLIADAGFDVLSHALEAVAAVSSSRFSNLFAEKAFALAFENLPKSFKGDVSARLPVHEAAAMAGLAFNQAGLGLCHALSHSLGGMFHVPHGRLNAILLPWVVEVNKEKAGDRYAELARAAGLGGVSQTVALRNLSSGLISLRRQLKLPETLLQAGVDPRELAENWEKILAAALKDPCGNTNPVPLTKELVSWVLEKVSAYG